MQCEPGPEAGVMEETNLNESLFQVCDTERSAIRTHDLIVDHRVAKIGETRQH